MRYAASILAGLIAISLPLAAAAQTARPVFQDNYAEVNGQRLHYASIGQVLLVLFLHGYPSFWYQWKDQMAEMGKDHLARRPRHARLQSVVEGRGARNSTGCRTSSRTCGGSPSRWRARNRKFTLVAHDWGANVAGLRDVPSRHARQAGHRQRRASLHLGTGTARKPGAALRQQ